MNKIQLFSPVLALSSVLILTPALSLADVYQWTDDSGKVHFSDESPNTTNNQEATPESAIKKVNLQPPNQFSVEDVMLPDEQVKSIQAADKQRSDDRAAANKKRTKKAQNTPTPTTDRTDMATSPDWHWQNGTVKNPYYNSSLTKSSKGTFILRTEIRSCKAKNFKEDKSHLININGSHVKFKTVCIDGLVSQTPEHGSGNRTIDKQFSQSTGSVDIGGVRYGVEGYN